MQNLSFYLLNAEETYVVSNRLAAIFNSELGKDEFVVEVYPLLNSTVAKLSTLINLNQNKEHTQSEAQGDNDLSKAFIALRDYLKALVNAPDVDVQKAALKLLTLTQKVGWSIYDKGYAAEIANLNNFLLELEKQEFQEALQTISATCLYDQLKACQVKFKETFEQEVIEEEEKESPLLIEIKTSISKYIKPLLAYIDLRSETAGGPYKTATDKASEIISGVMSIAQARQTRKRKAKRLDEEVDVTTGSSEYL